MLDRESDLGSERRIDWDSMDDQNLNTLERAQIITNQVKDALDVMGVGDYDFVTSSIRPIRSMINAPGNTDETLRQELISEYNQLLPRVEELQIEQKVLKLEEKVKKGEQITVVDLLGVRQTNNDDLIKRVEALKGPVAYGSFIDCMNCVQEKLNSNTDYFQLSSCERGPWPFARHYLQSAEELGQEIPDHDRARLNKLEVDLYSTLIEKYFENRDFCSMEQTQVKSFLEKIAKWMRIIDDRFDISCFEERALKAYSNGYSGVLGAETLENLEAFMNKFAPEK